MPFKLDKIAREEVKLVKENVLKWGEKATLKAMEKITSPPSRVYWKRILSIALEEIKNKEEELVEEIGAWNENEHPYL